MPRVYTKLKIFPLNKFVWYSHNFAKKNAKNMPKSEAKKDSALVLRIMTRI